MGPVFGGRSPVERQDNYSQRLPTANVPSSPLIALGAMLYKKITDRFQNNSLKEPQTKINAVLTSSSLSTDAMARISSVAKRKIEPEENLRRNDELFIPGIIDMEVVGNALLGSEPINSPRIILAQEAYPYGNALYLYNERISVPFGQKATAPPVDPADDEPSGATAPPVDPADDEPSGATAPPADQVE